MGLICSPLFAKSEWKLFQVSGFSFFGLIAIPRFYSHTVWTISDPDSCAQDAGRYAQALVYTMCVYVAVPVTIPPENAHKRQFYSPTPGSITCDNYTHKDHAIKRWWEKITIIPQCICSIYVFCCMGIVYNPYEPWHLELFSHLSCWEGLHHNYQKDNEAICDLWYLINGCRKNTNITHQVLSLWRVHAHSYKLTGTNKHISTYKFLFALWLPCFSVCWLNDINLW